MNPSSLRAVWWSMLSLVAGMALVVLVDTGWLPVSVEAADRVADTDGDGLSDLQDNCVTKRNPDQRDTDADGYGNLCDPDLNNDLIVNLVDLVAFKSLFFTADPDADFDGDGIVGLPDLIIVRNSYFQAPGPSGVAAAATTVSIERVFASVPMASPIAMR